MGVCKVNPFLPSCQQMKQMKLFHLHKFLFCLNYYHAHIFDYILTIFILDVLLTDNAHANYLNFLIPLPVVYKMLYGVS